MKAKRGGTAARTASERRQAAPLVPPPVEAEPNQPPPFTPPEPGLQAGKGSRVVAAPVSIAPFSAPDSAPPATPKPETATLDDDVFEQIRLEIKGRLPYLQACADAARRRGGPDVRRLQVTYTIAADGTVKELKLENVPDPQLATCITRMAGRPFPVRPGMDLTIPTPIVFIR